MKIFKRYLLVLYFLLACASAQAIQPQRGYRGFIDWSGDIEPNVSFLLSDHEGGRDSELYMGLSTSHGYQFNNWLYVGGGAGFEYNFGWKSYYNSGEAHFFVPVFAETRLDAKWGRFTPFLAMRLGANVVEHGGIYFSPTVGYRFNWGRKSAINLSLGMTLFSRRSQYHDHVLHPDGGLVEGPLVTYHPIHVKFAFRLGFEFQLPMSR